MIVDIERKMRSLLLVERKMTILLADIVRRYIVGRYRWEIFLGDIVVDTNDSSVYIPARAITGSNL
jgi:hypothetical protein